MCWNGVHPGSKFWRTAKKVRAVSKDEFCASSKKGKRPLPAPYDDDDDFLPPFPRSGRSKQPSSSMVPTGGNEMSEKVQALEFRVRKIESQLLQQDDDQEKVTLKKLMH